MRTIHCILILVILGIASSQESLAQSELPISFATMRKRALDCTLTEALKIPAPFLSEILNAIEQTRQEFTEKEKSHVAALRGIVEFRNDNPVEAIRYLTVAIDIDQTDPLLFWLRARCLAETKDYSNAKSDCEQSISIDYDFIPASLTMAGLYLAESKFDEAGSLLKKLGQIDGISEPAYLNYLLAHHALKSNKPSDVMQFANLAITSHRAYLEVKEISIWKLRLAVSGLRV